MASLIYTEGKTALMKGSINLETSANMYAALVKDSYNELPSHSFASINTHIAGTSNSAFIGLTSCAVTNGTFDADDPTFASVASGSTVEGLLIYHDTGVVKTLIAYIMPGSSGGFPFSTNGANVVVSFDAAGIFTL